MSCKLSLFRSRRLLLILVGAGVVYFLQLTWSVFRLSSFHTLPSNRTIEGTTHGVKTKLNSSDTIKTSLIIRGINPIYSHLYLISDDNHTLKCPKSNKSISVSKLNDDYCDCDESGFDEPGTDACRNSRFYCQPSSASHAYLPSSKVNDGICDCCDGSDEWMNLKLLPEYFSLTEEEQKKIGTFIGPCSKRC
ncbi:Uncharacterised protein g9234 [Pycnogonum litorale]